jgi:hypothetical protein
LVVLRPTGHCCCLLLSFFRCFSHAIQKNFSPLGGLHPRNEKFEGGQKSTSSFKWHAPTQDRLKATFFGLQLLPNCWSRSWPLCLQLPATSGNMILSDLRARALPGVVGKLRVTTAFLWSVVDRLRAKNYLHRYSKAGGIHSLPIYDSYEVGTVKGAHKNANQACTYSSYVKRESRRLFLRN